METVYHSKDTARAAVWDALARERVARFPLPPHRRIPNFAGAREAVERLPTRPAFRRASRAVSPGPPAGKVPERIAVKVKARLPRAFVRVLKAPETRFHAERRGGRDGGCVAAATDNLRVHATRTRIRIRRAARAIRSVRARWAVAAMPKEQGLTGLRITK